MTLLRQGTRVITASEDDSAPVVLVWDLRNYRTPERVSIYHQKEPLFSQTADMKNRFLQVMKKASYRWTGAKKIRIFSSVAARTAELSLGILQLVKWLERWATSGRI